MSDCVLIGISLCAVSLSFKLSILGDLSELSESSLSDDSELFEAESDDMFFLRSEDDLTVQLVAMLLLCYCYAIAIVVYTMKKNLLFFFLRLLRLPVFFLRTSSR